MSETNEKKVSPVYERVFRDVQDKNLRKAYIYLLSKEGKKDLAVYDRLGIKNDPSLRFIMYRLRISGNCTSLLCTFMKFIKIKIMCI